VSGPDAAGELEAQYEALRNGLGAYHLARQVVSVEGADAVSYLQGQLSQDIEAMAVGGSAESLVLAPDGKLVALVEVLRTGDESFVLVVASGFADALIERLARFKLRSKVTLRALDWRVVALRGAALGEAAAAALSGPGGIWTIAVQVAGTSGVDLVGPEPDDAVPDSARWCSTEAWEALRVEAGIPEMGSELDTSTIAAEAHLLSRAVSFTKGCYTGQELVARLDARGNKVARRLYGLVMAETEAPVASFVGATISVPGATKVVGKVTSAARCPGLGAPAALAYLHRSVEVPGLVELRREGALSALEAQARPLPLVG